MPRIQKSGVSVIDKCIAASLKRGDSLLEKLEERKADQYIFVHKTCVLQYQHNTARFEETVVEQSSSVKRQKRSLEVLDYKKRCFICGEFCAELDLKHPSRYKPFAHCETIARTNKLTNKTFKENILSACDDQGAWGNEVRVRIADLSDLPAADCIYHVECRR